MHFPALAILAMLSARATCLVVDEAKFYSEAACGGQAHTVNPDNTCTLLPKKLQRKIAGAEIPEGVVCDFYTDKTCKVPLWIGMEDPGTCDFSELEIDNQAVSVHCYDDTERVYL